jgi:uncharacterized damage-inducible protein DinB
MTWTAPAVERIETVFASDEPTMLMSWLEWHRSTLLGKCAGLTGDELAQWSVPPSNLSLLGLLRHMTEVERSWFRQHFRGEDLPDVYPGSEDQDIAGADGAHAEADYARFIAEVDATRRAVDGADLDETFEHPRLGTVSLRWIYVHMIEEYARHNGHADLLRERIDGVTGS